MILVFNDIFNQITRFFWEHNQKSGSYQSDFLFNLQVMIDIDGQHEWRDCLDIPGVKLPQGYYFGATAITGDLSGKHVFTDLSSSPKSMSALNIRREVCTCITLIHLFHFSDAKIQ